MHAVSMTLCATTGCYYYGLPYSQQQGPGRHALSGLVAVHHASQSRNAMWPLRHLRRHLRQLHVAASAAHQAGLLLRRALLVLNVVRLILISNTWSRTFGVSDDQAASESHAAPPSLGSRAPRQ